MYGGSDIDEGAASLPDAAAIAKRLDDLLDQRLQRMGRHSSKGIVAKSR